jgi:hypothetical protein
MLLKPLVFYPFDERDGVFDLHGLSKPDAAPEILPFLEAV